MKFQTIFFLLTRKKNCLFLISFLSVRAPDDEENVFRVHTHTRHTDTAEKYYDKTIIVFFSLNKYN